MTFFFREKLQLKETFWYLIRKMISEFFSVKSDENCFSIVSCLCVFSSRRIWIFFANPYRKPQKIKKLQIVLCSLKLVLIFQLDIQDICQIQHNFKTLEEANKLMENYTRLRQFSVIQEVQGFKTKVCIILDV